ncbi:hypothetical protein THIOM_001433 [Candidatus Thiomargarita nelsonii]|uniref:Uncharacterized protein n=1 Tax=Candidatus Thiomargarita nelsonii TaxID=1003181 RepID=A0A0A6NZN4_9GAMM|nr:hypothetical protein THIOM_001433 [Candidatus Thiomargarita nelsonii]
MISFDQALDTVMQLPFEQREQLIDIIRHRDNESRRREIAKEAREARADFQAGKFKPQPVQEIITELHQSLNEVT